MERRSLINSRCIYDVVDRNFQEQKMAIYRAIANSLNAHKERQRGVANRVSL
jgi:hypothetical protein